jgi:hypothetical protein
MDKSLGPANEKPRPGEENAAALKGRKETRGSRGNVTVQNILNTFREERDVIEVTFLRVPAEKWSSDGQRDNEVLCAGKPRRSVSSSDLSRSGQGLG